MHDVVCVAPCVRTVAAGEPAVPVPHDHRSAHGRRDHGRTAPDVERFRAPGHHHTHHRGVARDPTRGLRVDRADVVELAHRVLGTAQHLGTDRDRHVRALSGHARAVGPIQPLAADLAERVGSALRWRAIIGCPRARSRVEHRSQRRQERLARFRVQVAVDTHHPEERDRGMQASLLAQLLLALHRVLTLGGLAPVRRDALEVVHRVDPRGLDELSLGALERRRVGVPGRRQHAHRGHRDLARVERLTGHGHLLERPRDPHVLAGRSPRHLVRAGEPRGHREVSVALEEAPAFDLGQPSAGLRRGQLAQLGKFLHGLLQKTRGFAYHALLSDHNAD